MSQSGPAKVVLGLPLYGHHEHVRPAVESLLGQTHAELSIVVCDDGRGSREDIADLLSDPRVDYRRNGTRLGLIGNWLRVFDVGRSLHPDGSYFAWVSDHDLWEPEWAERLIQVLERSPDAVLAYPRVSRLEPGTARSDKTWTMQTTAMADPSARLRWSYDRLAAGDMIYGLFRTSVLERVGVFPTVLAPDRLLLAQLSLQGTFLQVPERLWSRRREARFSLERQRAALFGRPTPWYARLPWWLQHIAVFTRNVCLRDHTGRGRGSAARLSILHAWLAVRRATTRFVARRWTRARVRLGALAGRWLSRLRTGG